MYECPNCAGNLTFDITRQQLCCEYCGTQVDPYSFEKEKDAQETGGVAGEYEVTVFTCPQCGGEIISEDTTAATFCSFCGGSTILDSRIRKERRPVHIIPFTKTKKDCRAAYGKLLGRAFFAPKDLKDAVLIEKFRGIYMPYWVYSFDKKGPVTFTGKRTHRAGDYLITDHYKLDCQVQETYKGLAYDASSTFSDSLSEAIAPFDMKAGKPFTPSFLSGFYADTNDVERQVYMQEAEELVIQDACQSLAQDPVCRNYQAGQGEQQAAFREMLRPSGKRAELAMLPVWFLSYRNGDRVSYAVVNGQTGKAAADIPVDVKRYLTCSFLLAVPLFILLNLFLTIMPEKLLLHAAVLAFISLEIARRQLSHISSRETGEADKGLLSVRSASGRGGPGGKGGMSAGDGYPATGHPEDIHPATGHPEDRHPEDRPYKAKWLVLMKPLGGIAVAVAILILHPVYDWFYYIGASVCMIAVLWTFTDIIRQHALLTTRKLPQLNSRGGDEVG